MSNASPGAEVRKTFRNIPKNLLLVGLAALITGTITSVLTAYSHYIQASVESFWTDKSATGPYVAIVKGYRHKIPPPGTEPERLLYQYAVDLKKAGTLLFGQMTYIGDTGKQTYKIAGFIRDQFISISYEDENRDNSGTGTFALQKSGEHSMVGVWTGLECKGDHRILLQCPAVFYRSDKNTTDDYNTYIDQECEEIPIKPRAAPPSFPAPAVNPSAQKCKVE